MPVDPTTASFDTLPLYRYRIDLELERPLDVPAHQRGILWRGAFGHVFRSLVCHDMTLDCAACHLRGVCPYPAVFAPAIPAGRPIIARLADPPRPFVLADPHPTAPALPARTPLALGLGVVGTARAALPYFIVTLRKLGEDGIGRDRARFRLLAARALDASGLARDMVFEQGADVVRPVGIALRAHDLARPGDAAARRIRIEFRTPADIRGGAGSEGLAPPFGVLVRRARDRIGALATFFGDGPIGADPREVGDQADRVALVAAEVRRASVTRRSARTGLRHPVEGIVGTAVYEGPEVAALMPWLRLAEVVGVGKYATFGNGRIAVDVLG